VVTNLFRRQLWREGEKLAARAHHRVMESLV